MNFIIVTLNTASIALLKKISGYKIQVVQNYKAAIEAMNQVGTPGNAGIQDCILLTEFSIPRENGQPPDPFNSWLLAIAAADRYIPEVIIGLSDCDSKNKKLELLSQTFLKKQSKANWYLTKRTLSCSTSSEFSTDIYFVSLPAIMLDDIDQTLFRPMAYDWPAIIKLVEENLK